MVTTESDLTGRVIASQFRIERLLGRGGMGAVYLAEQLDMGRRVVVKVMNPGLMGTATDLEERFKREARIVAQLNHPHVVQVYVFGRTDDDQLYIAMEYIEGRTLRDVVAERGALPEARALHILDQICDALVEAHDLGLVHRDLKPDNIMLTQRHGSDDYVKVLDFGIAKMRVAPGAGITQTGAIIGTPQYMAPEQAQGKKIDQRTDIYALGVILHEMLTGSLPFSAESALDYLIKHISEPMVAPTQKFAGLVILPRTEAIVTRALEKPPERRFQSAAEMRREVRLALRDRPDAANPFLTPQDPIASPAPAAGAAGAAGTMVLPVSGRAPPAVVPAAAPPKGGRWLAVLAGGALVLALGGTGALFAVGITRGGEGSSAHLPSQSAVAVESPPAGIPAAGPLVDGLPAPRGAALVAAMPQAVTLRSDLSPQAILAFYRHHLEKKSGPAEVIANGLAFKSPAAPLTHVQVSRTGGGLIVTLTRNALAPAPPATSEGQATFGVPVPPGAVATLRTGTNVVYQLRRPIKDVVDFYRARFHSAAGIRLHETEVQGAPYLLIIAEKTTLPFQNVAVMVTPDALKPGAGTWTQIALTAR